MRVECPFCSATLNGERATFDQQTGDVLCSVVDVPIQACPTCGERFVSGTILAGIEDLARDESFVLDRRRVVITHQHILGRLKDL